MLFFEWRGSKAEGFRFTGWVCLRTFLELGPLAGLGLGIWLIGSDATARDPAEPSVQLLGKVLNSESEVQDFPQCSGALLQQRPLSGPQANQEFFAAGPTESAGSYGFGVGVNPEAPTLSAQTPQTLNKFPQALQPTYDEAPPTPNPSKGAPLVSLPFPAQAPGAECGADALGHQHRAAPGVGAGTLLVRDL